ncbi:hypothetical protein HaLaN_05352, partial [Haematococcus lacustris]
MKITNPMLGHPDCHVASDVEEEASTTSRDLSKDMQPVETDGYCPYNHLVMTHTAHRQHSSKSYTGTSCARYQ